MSKAMFILQPAPHPSRRLALQAIQNAPDGMVVTIAEETRSQEQNRLLWPLLMLWEQHQTLVINGREGPAPRETWKTILLAGYRKNHGRKPDFAIGLDGELIPLGFKTSTMGVKDFRDFLTYVLAETLERKMELPPRAAEECQGFLRSAA